MAFAYYALPTDDRALLASAVASANANPDYPAANLITANPAKPAKLTTTSGDWVVQLASALEVAAVAIPYHYIDAGLSVRIQANTSDSWGAPAFDAAITIPAKRLDGPSYQPWTQTPYLIFDTPQTYQYWRLVIVGTNSQPVVVGRLMLLAALRPITLYFGGSDIEEADGPPEGLIETVTELGVDLPVVIGGPRRSLSCMLIASDQYAAVMGVAQASEFIALHQSIDGRLNPFLLIPRAELNDAWVVRPQSAASARSHKVGTYEVWPFSVREVSRGLPWP